MDPETALVLREMLSLALPKYVFNHTVTEDVAKILALNATGTLVLSTPKECAFFLRVCKWVALK